MLCLRPAGAATGVGCCGRPICLFPGLYRLWCRLHRGAMHAWDDAHPRSYFANGRGNSGEREIWRHGVLGEAAVVAGGVAAAICWDL